MANTNNKSLHDVAAASREVADTATMMTRRPDVTAQFKVSLLERAAQACDRAAKDSFACGQRAHAARYQDRAEALRAKACEAREVMS